MAYDAISLLPILKYRGFVIGYGMALVPLIVLMGTNALYLMHSEEYMPVHNLVQRQRTGTGMCIYGTSVHQNDVTYKLEGYRQSKPRIAVMGASRVMQMRERYFGQTFYNLGGTATSVDSTWHVTKAILAEHAPDVLLIGIDHWWFNDAVRPPVRSASLPDPPRLRLNVRSMMLPTRWLIQRKIRPQEYIRTVAHAPGLSTPCALGVRGQRSHTGFGPDGSHYYTSFITGKATPTSTVALIRKRIVTGSERFQYGARIHPVHWMQFEETLNMLEKAGVHVILFIPPMHPEIVAEMERYAAHYGYVEELHRRIRNLNVPFFDFHNPALIGSSACEFIDAYHAGDVTSARMLQYIYEHSDNQAVRSVIAIDTVRATIAGNTGLAMAKDPRVTREPEVDFLGIGCPKR